MAGLTRDKTVLKNYFYAFFYPKKFDTPLTLFIFNKTDRSVLLKINLSIYIRR